MAVLNQGVCRVALALIAFVLLACGSSEDGPRSGHQDALPSSGPLGVAVSNYPMKYFTERIGGDEVRVVYLVPAGEDPAFWTPSAEEVRQVQQAELVVLNGATYEKWLPTVTLADSKLVDTSAGFRDRWLAIAGTPVHSHGPGGEHSHEGTDFNTWLDPLLAMQQGEAIRGALAARRPAAAQEIQENFLALERDLQGLHEQLEEATKQYGEEPLVASHPVYGYFARRYGLNVRSVLWEPDEMPSDEQWEELRKLLAGHAATVMLWEGEPLPEIEAGLNQMGVTSCPVIPGGNTPEEGDYLEVWKKNVERLALARNRTGQ